MYCELWRTPLILELARFPRLPSLVPRLPLAVYLRKTFVDDSLDRHAAVVEALDDVNTLGALLVARAQRFDPTCVKTPKIKSS